jgi:hypothetical protein
VSVRRVNRTFSSGSRGWCSRWDGVVRGMAPDRLGQRRSRSVRRTMTVAVCSARWHPLPHAGDLAAAGTYRSHDEAHEFHRSLVRRRAEGTSQVERIVGQPWQVEFVTDGRPRPARCSMCGEQVG